MKVIHVTFCTLSCVASGAAGRYRQHVMMLTFTWSLFNILCFLGVYVRERAACLLPLPLQLLGLVEPRLTATLKALTVLQASQGPPCFKMRVWFFALVWFFSVREQLACCYCFEVCHRVLPIKIDISLLLLPVLPNTLLLKIIGEKQCSPCGRNVSFGSGGC